MGLSYSSSNVGWFRPGDTQEDQNAICEERQKPLHHLLGSQVTHGLLLPRPLTTNQRSYQPPLVADISNWKNNLFQPQPLLCPFNISPNKYFFAALLPSSV